VFGGANLVEIWEPRCCAERDRWTRTGAAQPSSAWVDRQRRRIPRSSQVGAPLPAIGGRASAVVVMVEPRRCRPHPRRTGHRLPHCRRDDYEPSVW